LDFIEGFGVVGSRAAIGFKAKFIKKVGEIKCVSSYVCYHQLH